MQKYSFSWTVVPEITLFRINRHEYQSYFRMWIRKLNNAPVKTKALFNLQLILSWWRLSINQRHLNPDVGELSNHPRVCLFWEMILIWSSRRLNTPLLWWWFIIWIDINSSREANSGSLLVNYQTTWGKVDNVIFCMIIAIILWTIVTNSGFIMGSSAKIAQWLVVVVLNIGCWIKAMWFVYILLQTSVIIFLSAINNLLNGLKYIRRKIVDMNGLKRARYLTFGFWSVEKSHHSPTGANTLLLHAVWL